MTTDPRPSLEVLRDEILARRRDLRLIQGRMTAPGEVMLRGELRGLDHVLTRIAALAPAALAGALTGRRGGTALRRPVV